MGFTKGAYANVWTIKKTDKAYVGTVTVSKKNKDTGGYDVSFRGNVWFCKEAANKAANINLPEKSEGNGRHCNIKLIAPDTLNSYDPEKYKQLLGAAGGNELLKNFIMANACTPLYMLYDFEFTDDATTQKSSTNIKSKQEKVVEDTEEDLPF